MLNLFRTPSLVMREGTELNKWSNLELQMDLTLNKYYKFYRGSDAFINSSNVLVRIISQNMDAINLNLIQFANSVKRNIAHMTSLHSITDFINPGNLTRDIFFDTDVSLLSVDNHILTTENWKELSPLKIVEHQEVNIGLIDMGYSKLSDDIVYCSLDILDLMVMFRSWRLERKQNNESASPNNFVARYVLPNAMKSFLNISLINKFMGFPQRTEISNSDIDFPDDLKRKISKVYTKHYEEVSKRRELMNYYLASIPTLHSNGLRDLQIPSESTGVNVLTFIAITRIRIYNQLLLLVEDAKAVSINNEYHNNTWFLIKFVMSNKALNKSNITTEINKILIDSYYKREKGGVR
jgi:hypothetical protein